MMRSRAGVRRIKGARWAAQCGELIETFELKPNFSTLSDVREQVDDATNWRLLTKHHI